MSLKTEQEAFLESIGFYKEKYMDSLWWVDPEYGSDNIYRYVFCDEAPTYGIENKTIAEIIKTIKANAVNEASRAIRVSMNETLANELEKMAKKLRR